MTAQEIAERIDGKVEVPVEGASAEGLYVGDLLSDVMGHAGEGCAPVFTRWSWKSSRPSRAPRA